MRLITNFQKGNQEKQYNSTEYNKNCALEIEEMFFCIFSINQLFNNGYNFFVKQGR